MYIILSDIVFQADGVGSARSRRPADLEKESLEDSLLKDLEREGLREGLREVGRELRNVIKELKMG